MLEYFKVKDKTLINKIYSLVESIDFRDFGVFEPYDHEVCGIQGNHVSGWIPNQDGGIGVSAMYFPVYSGNYTTNKEGEYYEVEKKECIDAFKEDYNLNDVDIENIFNGHSDYDHLFNDYESEWLGCSIASLDVYLKGNKVFIEYFINYKNDIFPRRCAEFIAEIEYTINEFMEKSNKNILIDIINKVEGY